MLKKNWQAIILKDFKENKSNRPSWKKMFVRIKSINSVETRHSTMTWVWLLFCCSCRICVSYPTLNCNKPYPLQSGLRELPWIQSRSFLQVQSSKCECFLFIFFIIFRVVSCDFGTVFPVTLFVIVVLIKGYFQIFFCHCGDQAWSVMDF